MKKLFTHKQLVQIAYRWVLKNASCGVAFKELVSTNNEIPDVIGFGTWGHSVVVEVKATRSDFLRDKKKPFRVDPSKGMGRRRYYCCPSGMISRDELPEGWGLVYVNEEGRATCVVRPERDVVCEYSGRTVKRWYDHECNRLAEQNVLYSALRRIAVKGGLDAVYLPVGVTPETPEQ